LSTSQTKEIQYVSGRQFHRKQTEGIRQLCMCLWERDWECVCMCLCVWETGDEGTSWGYGRFVSKSEADKRS